MGLNNDINKKLVDFVQELKNDGFVLNNCWYEKKGEFANIGFGIEEIKYGADVETEKFGTLKSSFTVCFSDLIKITEPLLIFIRKNSEKQIENYIQKNIKTPRQEFLYYFNNIQYLEEEKYLYDGIVLNLSRSNVRSWSNSTPAFEKNEHGFFEKTFGYLKVIFENNQQFELRYFIK